MNVVNIFAEYSTYWSRTENYMCRNFLERLVKWFSNQPNIVTTTLLCVRRYTYTSDESNHSQICIQAQTYRRENCTCAPRPNAMFYHLQVIKLKQSLKLSRQFFLSNEQYRNEKNNKKRELKAKTFREYYKSDLRSLCSFKAKWITIKNIKNYYYIDMGVS